MGMPVTFPFTFWSNRCKKNIYSCDECLLNRFSIFAPIEKERILTDMNKAVFIDNLLEAESMLYRVAKSILKNDEDCQDAIQEAIIKSYTNLDSLKKEAYFKTWLVRILLNECYNMLRSRQPQVSYEDYLEEQPYDSKEEYSALYEAIQKLKDPTRVMIILFYVEGFSIKEISRMLDVSNSAVKTRLSRGRKELRVYLEGDDENDE